MYWCGVGCVFRICFVVVSCLVWWWWNLFLVFWVCWLGWLGGVLMWRVVYWYGVGSGLLVVFCCWLVLFFCWFWCVGCDRCVWVVDSCMCGYVCWLLLWYWEFLVLFVLGVVVVVLWRSWCGGGVWLCYFWLVWWVFCLWLFVNSCIVLWVCVYREYGILVVMFYWGCGFLDWCGCVGWGLVFFCLLCGIFGRVWLVVSWFVE